VSGPRWKSLEDMTLEELRYMLDRSLFRAFADSLRARYCSPSMTIYAWGTVFSLVWLVWAVVLMWAVATRPS
jgi:hypothetical protein